MLMALGMFVFSLPTLTFDEWTRKSDYRHVTNPRVAADDATQATGAVTETISLTGCAMHEIGAGELSLDQLHVMKNSGDRWSLVDGTGKVWGSYVILSLDEKRRALFPDGTPRQIDFTLELLRVERDQVR